VSVRVGNIERVASGDYMLSVKFNDQHITGSPFAVHVERGQPIKGGPAKRINIAGYQVSQQTRL